MDDDPDRVHHSDLVVDEIRENPPGRDSRHLDEEYVTLKNDGETVLDIAGWTVEDEAGNSFEFPADTELDPGERVTLHSGGGTDTTTDYYWGSDHPMWRNRGDTLLVRDREGVIRIRESFNE